MHTGCNKTIPWAGTKEESGEVAEGIATLSLVDAQLMGVTLPRGAI